MKTVNIFLFLLFFCLFKSSMAQNISSIYDFSFKDIDDKLVNLNNFKGKPLLLVNTASRCGFTPQYKDLQNLFLEYRNTDLTIIAVTSNSFNQEYSTTEEIKTICLVNYDVGFLISSPLNVRGDESHEIYTWIREEYNQVPKWNFFKYLFNREGKLDNSWSSMTKPSSSKIKKRINSLL